MINFSTMGTLNYLYKYEIDKFNGGKILKFDAVIKNADNKYFNIYISAERKERNNQFFYDTFLKFKDKEGNVINHRFESFYILRLDQYIIYIDRTYRFKYRKESMVLDYIKHTWYNSRKKTENEYQVRLGDIYTNNSDNEKATIYITVDKDNCAAKCDNDISIKPIYFEKDNGAMIVEKTPIEIFNIGSTGIIHHINKKIYHDYYDDQGKLNHIEFSDLYIPSNPLLSNINLFSLLYKRTEIEDSQFIFYTEYDEYGIYHHNDSGDCNHLYETFVDEDNNLEQTNSLHPIHIDLSNVNITNSDNLYAMDSFIYNDEYNNKYQSIATFTREVRKLSDSEIEDIRNVVREYDMDFGPALYVEDFTLTLIDEIC